MRAAFIKVLSFFSAFLMLFLSPGGHIRQPLAAKKCPAYYGAPAEAHDLGAVEGFSHPYFFMV